MKGHGRPFVVAVCSTQAKAERYIDKHTPSADYGLYWEEREVY